MLCYNIQHERCASTSSSSTSRLAQLVLYFQTTLMQHLRILCWFGLILPVVSAGFFNWRTKDLIVPACIVGGVCLKSCVKVVTSGDECLVERFGKYNRRLGAGWHWIWKPVEVVSFHVTTREQVFDVPTQQCYTKDTARYEPMRWYISKFKTSNRPSTISKMFG